MKMNKIFLAFPLMGALLGSCSSFLEEENPSGVNSQTFYATEAGIEAGVKSCYTFMRQYYGKEEGYHLTEIGTDIFTAGDGCAAPEFNSYNVSLQGTSNTVVDIWQAWYLALNTCNEVIDKLPTSNLNEATKIIRLGEVRFMRAFYLWHIVETWGDVVLSTTPTTSPKTDMYRSSVDDFYKIIKEDLQYARENLPEATNEYGRVTRPAAYAFSARISLFTKEYDKALEYANALIGNPNYTLAQDYQELVDMATCNTVKENIFVCNYASQAHNDFNNSILQGPDDKDMTKRGGGNNAHMFFNMTYDKLTGKDSKIAVQRSIEYGRPFNRFMPTRFYLDLFDETIDSRYDACFRQKWYCNSATSLLNIGDLAILFTKHDVSDEEENAVPYVIIDRSYVYNTDGTVKNGRFNTAFKKFDDPTRGAVNDQHSSRDCVILRLAEMYLIAAEAQLNLNNKDEAAKMLNVVRRRAAFPGKEAEMEITANDVTIDFILDERARELGGEMTRWFDLKRTDKLLERVKRYNPDVTDIQPYHKLRPIPTTTLDAVTNKDEFKQNEGYK